MACYKWLRPRAWQAGNNSPPAPPSPLRSRCGALQRPSVPHGLWSAPVWWATESHDAVGNVRISLPSHPCFICGFQNISSVVFFFFSSTCSYSLSGVHFISPFYVCPSCLDKRKSKINIRHWSALRASLFWGVVSLLTWSPSENMPHVSSILELMLLWHVCSPTQGFYERKKTNYRRLWRRCLIPSAIKSKAKAITLL